MELKEIEKKVNENIELRELLQLLKDNNEIESTDKVGLIAACAFSNALFEYKITDQLGTALWRTIRYITQIEMPMQILDFTAMLYPHMDKYFGKILTPTAFNMVQRQAAAMLEAKNYKDDEHKAHLEKVANGQMPYGYSLEMPSIKEEAEDEVEKED